MKPKSTLKKYLSARIERYMESGEPVINLRYLLPAVEGQIELLEECLREWQKEGKIEWLLPLDPTNPEKSVVRFSHYITKHIPWQRY